MRRLLLPLMLALALPAAAQESDLDRQIEKLRGELVKVAAAPDINKKLRASRLHAETGKFLRKF